VIWGRSTIEGGRQTASALQGASEQDLLGRSTMRRIFWRIVPFVILAYVISQIDRSNIAIAAFQMNADLKLTAAQYGFAAGIFYIPYSFLDVPNNWMLVRVGARLWIARIMVSWGLACILMAFVVGPNSLYAIRFLLGAAEAGFYPGVIFYLSLWFPARHRAGVYALFSAALPIANLIGSPIAASLLKLDGLWALRGWQWVFLIESVPAILLGFLFYIVMADGPEKASWLSPQQRAWLVMALSQDRQPSRSGEAVSGWRAHFTPQVFALALVFAGSAAATVALGLWMPQILKGFGMSNMRAALLNMLPYAAASTAMLWWGMSSSGNADRVRRVVLPLLLIGVSLAAAVFTRSLVASLVLLSLAMIGTYALKGPFWALVSDWTPSARAATTIALINGMSNFTGFGATYLLGVIKDRTGSFSLACLPLGALAVVAAVTLLLLKRSNDRRAAA
jgi:ACS family tartrate transporter-like MFS transporter